MSDEVSFIAAPPSDFTIGERLRFQQLVAQAGEVGGAALATNIANARVLVLLKHDELIRGVAALKRPQDRYRKKIIRLASVELPASDWPYELGYVFIEPKLQGRGLSHLLVSKALTHCDDLAVFATVRADNGAMRAVLYRAEFAAVGQHYLGLKGRTIGLLTRNKVVPAPN